MGLFWLSSSFIHLYEESLLFPQSIKELNVEKYFARYAEQIPLGEGFQILLSVVYEDEAEFAKEVERIASIAEDCSNTMVRQTMTVRRMQQLLAGKVARNMRSLIMQNRRWITFIFKVQK